MKLNAKCSHGYPIPYCHQDNSETALLRSRLAIAEKALEEIAQFEYEQTPGGYTYPERVSRRALKAMGEEGK